MRSAGCSVLAEVHSDLELAPALSSPPRLVLVVHTLAVVSQTSLLLVLSNDPDLVVIQQNSRDDLLVHMVFGAQVSAVVEMGDILEQRSSFGATARITKMAVEEEELKSLQARYNVKEEVRVQLEVVLPASRRWTCC